MVSKEQLVDGEELLNNFARGKKAVEEKINLKDDKILTKEIKNMLKFGDDLIKRWIKIGKKKN